MTTDTAKLRRMKGAPPPAGEAPDVIAHDVRGKQDAQEAQGEQEPQRPLQFRLPLSVFESFSEMAAREFGYSHGAKKQLFLKMWNGYKARSVKG